MTKGLYSVPLNAPLHGSLSITHAFCQFTEVYTKSEPTSGKSQHLFKVITSVNIIKIQIQTSEHTIIFTL